ncbi:MAG: diacylglycerol kinase family lipid kinase [Lachnospiraceae bacterium]|nr:diacylglycerol kinase family lipid kinase [Lachnospiraceae bacterium]
MKSLLFIMNPTAGKTQVKDYLFDIIQAFSEANYRVTVFPTQKRMDARNIVISEGNKYDVIVCAGGDGTLDEVASGYMLSDCKVPLGYIPAGSTNDFARSLGIPLEPLAAVTNIITGIPVPVDVGGLRDPEHPESVHIPSSASESIPWIKKDHSSLVPVTPKVAEEYFIYIAAFGAFTELSYSTDQQFKNMFGHAAYILNAATSLSRNLIPYEATFEYGDTVITDTFVYAMITNSLSVGGLRNVILSDDIQFDDGEFECLLIKMPKTPVELQTILNSLLVSEVNDKYMYCFKAKEVKISSKEDIPWVRDGEFGGNHKQVIITNHQKKLPIFR